MNETDIAAYHDALVQAVQGIRRGPRCYVRVQPVRDGWLARVTGSGGLADSDLLRHRLRAAFGMAPDRETALARCKEEIYAMGFEGSIHV